jgi:hypothetical protein
MARLEPTWVETLNSSKLLDWTQTTPLRYLKCKKDILMNKTRTLIWLFCWVLLYFLNLLFHQLAISSTCHFINLLFHQLAISSTCHFINLPFHQLAVSLTCHFFNKSSRQFVILSSCFINLAFCWFSNNLFRSNSN